MVPVGILRREERADAKAKMDGGNRFLYLRGGISGGGVSSDAKLAASERDRS
jgi:hypothetical protein